MINQQIRARVEAIGFEGALIDEVAQRLTELAEDTIASEVTRYLTSAESRVQSADGDYTSYYRPVLSVAFGSPADGNSWTLAGADGTVSRWVTYHAHTGYADLFPQEGVPEFAFPDATEPVIFPLDADMERAESQMDAALAATDGPIGCTCHSCESDRRRY